MSSSTLLDLANDQATPKPSELPTPGGLKTRPPANPSSLHPPFGDCPSRLLDTPMAAACIGVASSSLDVDRCRRRLRIPHCKIGRKVLYREADLLAFLDRCRVDG